jgi:DNA-binding response OmpR family regulator
VTSSADVLVVDDEESLRRSVADILRGAGYSVMEAEDGQAALEVLESGTFIVMVLDQRMPRKTGLDVLNALSSVPAVIFMSAARIEVGDKEKVGSKVFSYLTKPVAPRFLLNEVAAAYRSAANR